MHATPIHTPRPPGCVRLLAGLAAWLFLTLGLAAQSAADGTINGRVTDAVSKSVLPGAEISVAGTDTRTATGKDGEFSLKLPAGTYDVTVNYLGQPSKTVAATVTAGTATTLPVVLGDEVVQLETFKVEGAREGQARAVNQQRTSSNLVSIISSDLSGQFPDKTIADAVKRLPGVTVETDNDTGGSEGRYITVRGMNADFNAVTINGMRVNVTNFEGSSRRVPLDVVSAKSADQIEVTKALRPDQDGDSIGGAVNIVTRSPFERDGVYAFAEAALGYSNLLDNYTGNYPYENPNTELSAGYSTTFGKEQQFGYAVNLNNRERAFAKQRIGSTGWRFSGGAYRPRGIALQDFFDDVSATGLNQTFAWRPSDNTQFRVDFSFNDRDTERGRQRTVFNTDTVSVQNAPPVGDTQVDYQANNRNVTRNVRQFFESQRILNLALTGETKADDWTFNYLAGANRGTFDGNAKKDINASFDLFNLPTASRPELVYQNNGYFPSVTPLNPASEATINNPGNYALAVLDRSTSYTTDDDLALGLDAKKDSTFLGGDGFWKIGGKLRSFSRDYTFSSNKVDFNDDWNLLGYAPDPAVGSLIANYNTKNSVNGAYTYPFFIDPNKVRNAANQIATDLNANAYDNTSASLARSYQADENVYAGYLMGQFSWGKITTIGGVRAELTRVEFSGYNADFVDNGFTDFDYQVNPATDRFTVENDYLDILPGIHLRYDQTKKLLYRASVTTSIARPRLNDLNPAMLVDSDFEEVTTGNIDLDPVSSLNFDLSADYYFNNAGYVTFGVFHKEMKNNIYTRRSTIPDTGLPATGSGTYTLIQPSNADSATVTGFEISYDQQFTFLPSPLDGFGFSANYTYADSEIDLGFPVAGVNSIALFDQVRDTVNLGIYYEKSAFRARLSMLYRSGTIFEVDTSDNNLSRFRSDSTTLDFTTSYAFTRNWSVFGSVQNLLNEPGRAYNGSEALRPDYNEYTDWSATVGLRWSL